MLTLISPFPLDRVWDAWRWHQDTPALTKNYTQEAFTEWFTSVVKSGGSWGVQLDRQLVGVVLFEPSFLPGVPSQTIQDGFFHICLAREAQGKRIFQRLGRNVISWLFQTLPGLLRVSAWTLGSNLPAKRVAEDLGFSLEGVMRDAAVETSTGATQDLVLYGLTRKNYYGWEKDNYHYRSKQ